jgi:hypothetical protein
MLSLRPSTSRDGPLVSDYLIRFATPQQDFLAFLAATHFVVLLFRVYGSDKPSKYSCQIATALKL